MCGRFSLKSTMKAIEDEFSIEHSDIHLTPRYNIAPTQNVAVVVNEEGSNRLKKFHWGLIPSWSKDPAIGNRMINARVETLNQKISFKNAFKKHRCLIIADGFYEWKKVGQEKIPMYIYLHDQKPFAFAGLWEKWKSPEGESVFSCTIITTSPNELLLTIHNRMPVILPKKHYPIWLDLEFQQEKDLFEILKPYPSDMMQSYQVSKYVNSPANDNPQCIKPSKY